MITKTKKSVSLSNSLNELKRQERGRRDMEIINANAKRFNKEAEENLKFQALSIALGIDGDTFG